MGDVVRLSFDIESREYNGRWFTSIRGWKADKIDAEAVSDANIPTPPPAVGSEVAPPPALGGDENDDLPF